MHSKRERLPWRWVVLGVGLVLGYAACRPRVVRAPGLQSR